MRGKIVGFIILLITFLTGGLVMYLLVDNTQKVIYKNSDTNIGVVKCDNLKIEENSIAPTVGEIYEATVTIEAYQNSKLKSTGSGFVYKTDDKYGYILTNEHVVSPGEELLITMANDKQVNGEVLGSDKYLDLAVVRIEKDAVIKEAKLGSSSAANVGDTVVTVGSPVGYQYRGTVTKGTLSGKNRMVEVSVVTVNDFVMQVLQIDAAINPGNSGGPLVNIQGEVIGINSLKLVEDQIEGIGFAIPIEIAVKDLPDFERGLEIIRPYIGISMLDTTDTYRLYRNGIVLNDIYDGGVVVTSITNGSGADKAGLKKGDIITKLNGNKVKNSAYLKYDLFQLEPNDQIEITYIRDGKEHTTKVTLTKLED